jgi:hypothetical protein
MEMQEMMECLLAKMDANKAGMKAMQVQMDAEQAGMKAMQEKADADRKADREVLKGIMDANTKSTVRAFQEKMDTCVANMKDDRKETTACHDEIVASIKKIEPNLGAKEAIAEWQKISNEEVAIHSLRACQSETAASQEDMETKPDPGKMQSVEEHQEIPKEEAAVMPIGELRKQRRDRNLAAGRGQKPKGRIHASSESRRRLTVASRKMTHYATVA